MSGSNDEGKPFAVVDRLAELSVVVQEFERDLFQSLPTEATIEVFEPQLARDAKRGLEFGE